MKQFGRLPYDIVCSGILASLGESELRAYIVICTHANKQWKSSPKVETIAKLSGISNRQIYRVIKQLKDRGLIEIKSGGGHGITNTYTIETNPDTLNVTVNPDTLNVRVDSEETCQNRPRTLTETAMNPDTQDVIGTEEQKNRIAKQKLPHRNPLWDAICDLFNLNPQTKSEKSCVGKIVRDLKIKNATPDDIAQRKQRYMAEWPGIECTANALVKHWDRFGKPVEGETGPADPEHIDKLLMEQLHVTTHN